MQKDRMIVNYGRVVAKWLLRGFLFLGLSLFLLYCWGLIYFHGPFGQAASGNKYLAYTWCVALVVLGYRGSGWLRRCCIVLLLLACVFLPYWMIEPSNERDWKPEFGETGSAVVEGDWVTLSNFRNFDYTLDGEVSERWETRRVRLSRLQGVDLFHDTFMGDTVAHPILSFDFGEDGHICLSIETRREMKEKFSAFGGLYKMFELQYIFSSEEDCIRLRTNIREEPVYMYRLDVSLDLARETFLRSVEEQNSLYKNPRFYNVLTANCTTSMRAQRSRENRIPFDMRILLNGLLDEYFYEIGGLLGSDYPFREFRQRCLINEAAKAAHADPAFSDKIRAGRPGQSL